MSLTIAIQCLNNYSTLYMTEGREESPLIYARASNCLLISRHEPLLNPYLKVTLLNTNIFKINCFHYSLTYRI